jgi:hypothetical protein
MIFVWNYGTAKEIISFVFVGSLTTNIYNNTVPTVKEYRKLNLSEEQSKRFHQDIKIMQVRYRGQSYDG